MFFATNGLMVTQGGSPSCFRWVAIDISIHAINQIHQLWLSPFPCSQRAWKLRVVGLLIKACKVCPVSKPSKILISKSYYSSSKSTLLVNNLFVLGCRLSQSKVPRITRYTPHRNSFAFQEHVEGHNTDLLATGLTLQWSPHRLGQSLRFLTQLPLFWSLHQRLWSLGPLLGSRFGSGGSGGAHHGQAICGQLHQLCNVHQRSRHVPRHVTQSNACHKSMQILETSGTPGCQKVSVKTPRQSNMPQNYAKV